MGGAGGGAIAHYSILGRRQRSILWLLQVAEGCVSMFCVKRKCFKSIYLFQTSRFCRVGFCSTEILKMYLYSDKENMPKPIIDTDEVEENIFDTHCHIDFILHRRLKGRLQQRPQTFSQLVRQHPGLNHQKLEGFITNFCYPPTWPKQSPPYLLSSVWLNDDLSVHYTVGCHPHFAGLLLVEGEIERLERLLVEGRARGCVAVGECGLDRSRGNKVDMATQVIAFKMQVRLAMKLNLPLVLHIREAEEMGRRVLRECGLPRDWPVHRHCWNDSWRRCRDWLEEYPGSAVGLTGLVTWRSGVIDNLSCKPR